MNTQTALVPDVAQDRLTTLDATELEDLFLLLPRILCEYRDPRRGPYKLAYIYANTRDNEDSSFLRAIELAQSPGFESLATSEGDLGHGYEGFDHSVKRLKTFGWNGPVSKLDVGGNVNTGSEAMFLADYVRSFAGGGPKGGDLAVIAPPFHIMRTFMTTVTAIKRIGVPMRVYAVPGVALSWNAQAAHSQGTLKDTRAGLLKSELVRLEKYRAPEFGSMLSAKEVLDYLDWRDR